MKREKWLYSLLDVVSDKVFAPVGLVVPSDIQIGVGFPSTKGLSIKERRIGECWRSEDGEGSNQIFISPVLDDPVVVAATLAHEIIHAIDNCKNGHKKPFKNMALLIGLEGKMTATIAGEALRGTLSSILSDLGPYPHKKLTPKEKDKDSKGSRLIKVSCPGCGYIVRSTKKWILTGLPSCPCGTEMETENKD